MQGVDRVGDDLADEIELALENRLIGLVSPRATKIWRWTGSVGLTDSPRPLGSTGTSRQPRTFWPCSAMTFSNIPSTSCGPRVARHEQRADGIEAGLRQGEAEARGFLREEAMRDLHQHAAAVASLGIGPDRAAMVEIEQDLQAHPHEFVGFGVVHIGDEADAAGVMFVAGVVKALRRRQAVGGEGRSSLRGSTRRVQRSRPLNSFIPVNPVSFGARRPRIEWSASNCPICRAAAPAPSGALRSPQVAAPVEPIPLRAVKWSARLSYLSARDIARLGSGAQVAMGAQT